MEQRDVLSKAFTVNSVQRRSPPSQSTIPPEPNHTKQKHQHHSVRTISERTLIVKNMGQEYIKNMLRQDHAHLQPQPRTQPPLPVP